jgi:hypothetical protein
MEVVQSVPSIFSIENLRFVIGLMLAIVDEIRSPPVFLAFPEITA